MKRVRVRVPLRVDLAGGTLDLWPLHLFHPGARTVNVAISMFAECEVSNTGDSRISVVLTDRGIERTYSSTEELAGDSEMALVARAIEHLGVSGVRIVTRTEAPRGSGLGGSSALAVALVRALTELIEQPVEGDDLIHLVRDLETRLLGVPAGVQDYYPPVYGGLASLHLEPGKIRRTLLRTPLTELAQHLVVYYSGVAHFSGTNNWEIYKRHIDGDPLITGGLSDISDIALRMERALEARDFQSAGDALAAEWSARKSLIQGISNEEIEAAISEVHAGGAWGAKVCGAGGGGCIVILCPAEKREAIVSTLAQRSGQFLPVAPTGQGIVLHVDSDAEAPVALQRRRSISGTDIEQLFLKSARGGPRGAWRPWALAEIAVTWDEPRIGVHSRISRTVAAPIDRENGSVDWCAAVELDPASLQFSPVAGSASASLQQLEENVLEALAGEARELLIEHLLQTEALPLLYNPELELYAEAGESRAEFEARCREVAMQALESESDRLESTFRRRLDQMRERSERDQRERHAKEEADPSEIRRPDLSISWGQALHRITTGRPASSEAPQSVDAADYAEKIARLQQQWDRELEGFREEQEIRARTIEEITLTPARRNIELVRYLVLWAKRLPATASGARE